MNSTELNQQVEEFGRYLLLLRKMQDKSGAEFLRSLGNLSMQELNILNAIGDHESCTMSDIAKQVSLSLSSVTVIADKLVKAKLVERIRSEEDRRIVRGTLTAEGKKIYHLQIHHLHDVLKKMLGMLSEEERKNLLTIFNKFTQNWV
jgi:DNA-binding MarR family transcriptional regulator